MIKPKSQSYKVKVMLIKLEAVTNRVATRCQASIKIGTYFAIKTGINYSSRLLPNSRRMLLSLTVKLNSNTSLFRLIKSLVSTKTNKPF